MQSNSSLQIRLHFTNIVGAGAVQVMRSLLPALKDQSLAKITELHVPAFGELSHLERFGWKCKTSAYRRFLPNAISRVLECTVFSSRFDGGTPLLVLGDIPLRTKSRQTVFIQTSHLTDGMQGAEGASALKYKISRLLFHANLRFARDFVVQTTSMKDALIRTYPKLTPDQVHVVSQPVPAWLMKSGLTRRGRVRENADLALFYPALDYPHKNHQLLRSIDFSAAKSWPVSSLTLTVDSGSKADPGLPWTKCTGTLSETEMLEHYATVDALVFLSLTESYGFPLIEAMWIGLPIVCADLPYARAVCGDTPIYFNPQDGNSLRLALITLREKLANKWWPDYRKQLLLIPKDWSEVAKEFLAISTCDIHNSSE